MQNGSMMLALMPENSLGCSKCKQLIQAQRIEMLSQTLRFLAHPSVSVVCLSVYLCVSVPGMSSQCLVSLFSVYKLRRQSAAVPHDKFSLTIGLDEPVTQTHRLTRR